jgi:L-ascorbate metabolism protein UlaG (beta-lactamase superfamily)
LTLPSAGCVGYYGGPHRSAATPGYVLAPESRLGDRRLTATFLGNTTVLVTDGETALMTDGFFSRPPWWQVLFGRVAPDEAGIRRALARARVERLDAVLVSHSHYDHAMDAPTVARLTGASLVGSESARQIALGGGIPEEDICVVVPEPGTGPPEKGDADCVRPARLPDCRVPAGRPLCFGKFRVTLVESRHGRSDLGGLLPSGPDRVAEPLRPPARFTDYRAGDVYSIHIDHPLGAVLVHGSAGFRPGALRGYRADVVFLGVALLGEQTPEYVHRYYEEVAGTVGAGTVVPIHWDDFTRGLGEPLRPLPDAITDVTRAIDFLDERLERDPEVSLLRLPEFIPLLVGSDAASTRAQEAPGGTAAAPAARAALP